MTSSYDKLSKAGKGAWVVHHGQKTSGTIGAGAQFPALEVAGKAAALLSQFAATDQIVLDKARVDALAAAAGINPKMELPVLMDMLRRRRVIDIGAMGDVEVIGLTSAVTVQHASELFEAENPTQEERAAIALAEITSKAPLEHGTTQQIISDEFEIASAKTNDLLKVSETIGFVDAEGQGNEKLYFNGNLFRRDNLAKVKRVLDSLSSAERVKVVELDGMLDRIGCVSVEKTERVLGKMLFEKLKAAAMYDVNHVANASGEFGFVTKPAAFHKFNDPMADDAFDLAKTLVAALTYGMTQSSSGLGKIEFIRLLLNKLNSGKPVGPATAIGEDYRVLEMRGVLKVQKASGYGYIMTLLKRDIGQMALAVLTTGETASVNSLSQILPGSMTGYIGPEKSRSDFRRKQVAPSKRMTEDVLQALRQQGGL
ncbi:hypothetical protein ACVDG8_016570 [Mesorhizobium sp. ORM8.1]